MSQEEEETEMNIESEIDGETAKVPYSSDKVSKITNSSDMKDIVVVGGLKYKKLVIEGASTAWDPTNSSDWDKESPTTFCLQRIKRDLTNIFAEKNISLYVVPDENDITKLHAVILGPPDTPYKGGFFYFFIRVPPTYPIQPPRVKLMTTDSGCVRFNPNLYANGKVCLSTLGTWPGPGWSAANSLLSVLLCIQSLMNEKPYFNEPGYNNERTHGASDNYNKFIIHETLRVAACGMANGDLRDKLPASLQDLVEKKFLLYYDHYLSVIQSHKHLDGVKFTNPFGHSQGKFQFNVLEERLNVIAEKLKREGKMEGDEEMS